MIEYNSAIVNAAILPKIIGEKYEVERIEIEGQ